MKRTSELARTSFRPQPVKEMKRRQRKCCVCRKVFEPRSMTHKACGPECSVAHVEAEKARQCRKERQEGLIALKPAKWWKSKAKTAMHLYVRTRDENSQCCSCDTILLKLGRAGGDFDAGHLRSVGSAKHLEFDARNVWGQCKYCNDRLHGNEREYERRLRVRIGDSIVDDLMADNESRHLKIHDYQEIERYYKAKLKALKASPP